VAAAVQVCGFVLNLQTSTEIVMRIDKVETHERALAVHWADHTITHYPYLFLRDNDPEGFHPQTRERQFDLLSVSPALAAKTALAQGESVTVTWNDAAQGRTVLSADWLWEHRPGQRAPNWNDPN